MQYIGVKATEWEISKVFYINLLKYSQKLKQRETTLLSKTPFRPKFCFKPEQNNVHFTFFLQTKSLSVSIWILDLEYLDLD